VGESLSIARTFVNNFGLTYTVLHDFTASVYKKYWINGISPYPRDVIIDAQGIVRFIHSEYDPNYMKQVINQLLDFTDIETDTRQIIPKTLQLRIFPNPFNSITQISFVVSENSPTYIELLRIDGKKVLSRKIRNVHTGEIITRSLNFSDYASGVYFISVKNGNRRETKKALLIK
jgi:hypothetical protein